MLLQFSGLPALSQIWHDFCIQAFTMTEILLRLNQYVTGTTVVLLLLSARALHRRDPETGLRR